MPKSCLPRFSQAHDFSKVVRHHLEHARLEPPSSLLVHRGPRREVIGQHPPWYAAANHVLQRVVDPPELVLTLRSILAHEAQAGRDERPFRIAAVTGVALLGHAMVSFCAPSRWVTSALYGQFGPVRASQGNHLRRTDCPLVRRAVAAPNSRGRSSRPHARQAPAKWRERT